MPKVSPIQNTFNVGEVSPLLAGRTEFDPYKDSLTTCLNFLPLIQGPITRRPGTYFCDELEDSTKRGRLIPFKFSTVQAYIIEFGDAVIRFKRNNGPVTQTPQNITAVSNGDPLTVTYAGADSFAPNDFVDITGVQGVPEINGRRFKIITTDNVANTMTLGNMIGTPVDSTDWGTYLSGGTVALVVRIGSPYSEADLPGLKFTQSGDVLYLTHPDFAPRKLIRASHTSWSLQTITNRDTGDGPWMRVNSTATTFTPAATTGNGVEITASAVSGINGDTGFQATDVGRLIRINNGAAWGYGIIVAVTDTTHVDVDILRDFSATTATANWRMGLYSDTTGYPATATFFEDRFFFGGCPEEPSRFDGSRTGDYQNFAPSDPDGVVVDDHAVSYTLNSDDVQTIRWMKGDEKALVIGTMEGEWPARPSVNNEAMTPTNINAKQSTARGTADIQAVRAGEALVYVQTSRRQLRELAYVFEADKFKTPDLTVLSEHITKGPTPELSGIVELTYQKQPQSIVWMPRADGVLLSHTYERDQKVLAWARHVIGGYSNSQRTDAAVVESAACIPSADGTRDELWLLVRRFINNRVVRYTEFLTKFWERGDDPIQAVYGDCALTYDSTPATTIYGLHHLAGETVNILADGFEHPTRTVSATGTITLTRAASVVQVGLGYNSDGQSPRMDAGAADGTAQGKIQRTHRVKIRLHDTLGIKFGPTFNTTGPGKLTEYNFRTSSMDPNAPIPLFTGDIEMGWEGSYTDWNTVCWRCSGMAPATVIALMPQMHTQDR